MDMPPERPLTTGDVARIYGVGASTVRRWVRSGLLPAFETPTGHIRVEQADVEAVIESTRHDGDAKHRPRSA